jgi:hypothetical protein
MIQAAVVDFSTGVQVQPHTLLGFFHQAVSDEADPNGRENCTGDNDDEQIAQDQLCGDWYPKPAPACRAILAQAFLVVRFG